MTLFAWLIIGHLIGDWLLQSDWMAIGKRSNWLNVAGLAHYSIYTATVGAAWLLAGTRGKPLAFYLAWSIVVFVLHWVIDASSLVAAWMRLWRQSNREMMRVMIDQTLHLIVLAVLATST
jgi:hypothetical protein